MTLNSRIKHKRTGQVLIIEACGKLGTSLTYLCRYENTNNHTHLSKREIRKNYLLVE